MSVFSNLLYVDIKNYTTQDPYIATSFGYLIVNVNSGQNGKIYVGAKDQSWIGIGGYYGSYGLFIVKGLCLAGKDANVAQAHLYLIS